MVVDSVNQHIVSRHNDWVTEFIPWDQDRSYSMSIQHQDHWAFYAYLRGTMSFVQIGSTEEGIPNHITPHFHGWIIV